MGKTRTSGTITEHILSLMKGGQCCFNCTCNWNQQNKQKLATSIADCIIGCTEEDTLHTMVYMSNLIGNMYESTTNNNNNTNNNKKQKYLLPPLSNYDDDHVTIVVCEECLYAAMDMNKYYRRVLNNKIDSIGIPPQHIKDLVELAMFTIPSNAKTRTPIAIASHDFVLSHSDVVIELDFPYESERTAPSNANPLHWTTATLNGLQIRGDITIDPTKRTTIITSVANVNKCISDEGRDASFCYLGGASVHTNNAKAILSYHCPAISGVCNMSELLVHYLAEGIQHHKKNIIKTGKHNKSSGYYGGLGNKKNCERYQRINDTTNISATATYATINVDTPEEENKYRQLEQICIREMEHKCKMLDNSMPGMMVKTNSGQVRICELVNTCNNLNNQLDTRVTPIQYLPFDSFYNSSYNFCVDAQTEIAHCENDTTMTILLALNEPLSKKAYFDITVNPKCKIRIPLLPGCAFTLNAHYLTHNQVLEGVLEGDEFMHQKFVNLAAYSNRVLNDAVVKALRRGTNVLIKTVLKLK